MYQYCHQALTIALILTVLFGLSSCREAPPPSDTDSSVAIPRLAIDPAHPAYWTYNGMPTLLIGGSREDNLFQIPGLEAHLDSLAAVGGNYIRNTLSSRDPGNVWPFAKNEQGLYDLERFDTAYFNRLQRLLMWTAERDIIVQIELWDRFDYARENWLDNPFRPANNVNYDTTASGLSNYYPRHPGQNDNRFFYTVPALDSHSVLLPYQQRYVDRVLAATLPFGNVLYCMDNETNGDPAWGAYWSAYLKTGAAESGKTIYTTEMWDAWDIKQEEHRATFDHPGRYDFVDISQNNHNKGEEHWANLQWARSYVKDPVRPLNHVKIYGSATSRYGSERDAVERFWRNLVGGAASVRFHRPPSGLGLSRPVRQSLQAARLVLDSFDLYRARPDADHQLLENRSENEVFLSYTPGKAYLLYYPDGGSVDLDLRALPGSARLQWLSIMDTPLVWGADSLIDAGRFQTITAPAAGHWLALVRSWE